MKILTDFDGVLTNLGDESLRVKELFLSFVNEAVGDAITHQLFHFAENEMRQNPHLHGWRSDDGRVTAFSNEDGFIFVNGLAGCLDETAIQKAGLAREGAEKLRAAGSTFRALAQAAYSQMTRETQAGRQNPMDPGAGATLTQLASAGHSIVVVSNSGTDRIQQILAGSDARPALQGSNPKIRIRGNARKFVLGNGMATIDQGFFRVFVDRPVYREILLEEQPDIVIGDVFSLDLSLPIFLGQREKWRGCRTFLRKREYTPAWSLEQMELQTRGGQGGILEHFDELVDLA